MIVIPGRVSVWRTSSERNAIVVRWNTMGSRLVKAAKGAIASLLRRVLSVTMRLVNADARLVLLEELVKNAHLGSGTTGLMGALAVVATQSILLDLGAMPKPANVSAYLESSERNAIIAPTVGFSSRIRAALGATVVPMTC